MLNLRLFGGLTVRAADRQISGAGVQRRPLAVLAILAVAGENGMSRDRLVSLLWPDSDDARARSVLRQTLYALRRDLGEPDLVLGTADIRLNPAVVQSDHADFLARLAANDRAGAVAVYDGPFLDGVHLTDALEFERWVEYERARLAASYATTLEALANEADAIGDVHAAVKWWRLLASTDPLNARIVLGAMSAYAAAGDRAGALQLARAHEAALAGDLGATPAPAVRALVERIRYEDRTAHAVPVEPPRPTPTDAPWPPPRLVATPAGVPTPPFARRIPAARTLTRLRRRRTAIGVALVLAWTVVTVVVARGMHSARPARRDGGAIAVVVGPFNVGGADPSLAFLREGMMDLLAATLTSDIGRRAVDVRSTLAAWQHEAQLTPGGSTSDVARRVGASLDASEALVGSVVGTPQRLVITATVLDLADDDEPGHIQVVGSIDSLPQLVDRFTARLLTLRADAFRGRAAGRSTESLPALRSYFAGRAFYRSGRFADAYERYRDALAFDPGFALAAVGALSAKRWDNTELSPLPPALVRSAWASQGDLSERDRTILAGLTSLRYPLPSPQVDYLRTWERVVELAPNHAEGWFELGDVYYHWGAALGIRGWEARAENAFTRALALDSTFGAPAAHLAELAARFGQPSQATRLEAQLARDRRGGELADYLAWRIAVMRNDAATLRAIRARASTVSAGTLERIVGRSQIEGLPISEAAWAMSELERRAPSVGSRWSLATVAAALALNSGHPADATTLLEDVRRDEPVPGAVDRQQVLDALFWSGDAEPARAAVVRLEADAYAARAAVDSTTGANLCAIALWSASRGDLAGADRAIGRLSGLIGRLPTTGAGELPLCAATAAAIVESKQPGAGPTVAAPRLDALDRQLAEVWGLPIASVGNLVAARVFAERGELSRAMAAVRRRPHLSRLGVLYLSEFLALEQDVAARLHLTDDTVRASRTHVALRERYR